MRMDAGTLRCALVHGRKGVLARESAVQSPLLVASEVREIEGRNDERQVLLTMATAIKDEWLRELFPEAFAEGLEVQFDPVQRRVIARRTMRFRDLVLRSKETDQVPLDEAAVLLAQQVAAGECPLKQWDDAVEQWIVRLNLLAGWFPEWELPPLGPEDRQTLMEQICHGAISYREIKERPVWPVVKSWLSPAQQGLVEEYAPERLAMPNGRRFKIVYDAKAAPTIAARIQDLYGVEGDLRIARRTGAAGDPGAGAESAADPGDAKPRELLEGVLSEAQAGAAAEISEARVALMPRLFAHDLPLDLTPRVTSALRRASAYSPFR